MGNKPENASLRATSEELAPWYRRCLVGIEWGPTGANAEDPTYMSKADGAEIIRQLAKARAEYAVVFMKDMEFAYYNSRVAKKTPGLGKRDLLRECLVEDRKYRMPESTLPDSGRGASECRNRGLVQRCGTTNVRSSQQFHQTGNHGECRFLPGIMDSAAARGRGIAISRPKGAIPTRLQKPATHPPTAA